MSGVWNSIDAGNHDGVLLAIAALLIGSTLISAIRQRARAR